MPAFNGENFIQQAIESVISQTYPNWELIIVDDGSTDATAGMIHRYSDEARIRSVYQENKGQASALNHGLDLAVGEFVTTLDTDDWFTSNSLLDRVNYLKNHPEFGTVYGDGFYCDVNEKILKRFSEYRIGNITGDVYDTLITSSFFGTGANVMIRREILEKFHIRYDETIFWCQDLDLYIRVAEKCMFGLVDSMIVWYRIHKTNMTMSAPHGRRLESLIRTKNKVLSSVRFETTRLSAKTSFFLQFLRADLQGRPDDQTAILKNKIFLSLPKSHQARIIRLVANQYLSLGKNEEFVKDWLIKAWRLSPLDMKIVLSILLSSLNPSLVKRIMGWWRQRTNRGVSNHSPFEYV
jgi:glycosyltransferase involved in cell wall biosynthesis